MYTHLFFFLLLSIALAVSCAAAEDEQFRICSGEPYSCGQFQNLTYPFWGGNRPQFCGHKDFNLTCHENEYPIIDVDGVPFRVHDVSQTNHTMKLSRFDLQSNFCTAPEPGAGRFNPGLFQYGSNVKPLFIYYDCSGSDDIPIQLPKFGCDVQGRKRIGFCAHDSMLISMVAGRLQCRRFIDVPVSRVGLDGLFTGSENIQQVLDAGLAVEYKPYSLNCSRCEGSQGACGSDPSGSEFVCVCRFARDQTDSRIVCSTHATEANFTDCGRRYSCGSIQNVGYPFWGNGRPRHCGLNGFNLSCINNNYSLLQINMRDFRLLEINQSQPTMRITSNHMWDNVCSPRDDFGNNFVGGSLFRFTLADSQITIFYDCSLNMTGEEYSVFACPRSVGGFGNGTTSFVADRIVASANECKTILPFAILKTAQEGLRSGNLSLQEVLNLGFEIQYEGKGDDSCSRCEASGGVCGSQIDTDQFLCFCPDHTHPVACRGSKTKTWLAIKIGTPLLGVGILGVCLLIYWFRRQLFFDKRMVDDQSLEDFVEGNGSFAPKRYSYSEIKKMTNYLKDKIGQGGFGSVYKGKLPDGNLVAVKILNVLKGNGEDFINEVASISRTSHVNVVTLKGYCLQGRKRALVYDFISRGSLEKFIINKTTTTEVGSARLDWGTLYRVAVGIARGLEYLHSGCNTRILHLDIKPHNILLDDNFYPKISDFGLAKLCTGKESILSMIGARGTIGYIAPEVFCRNFGGVSYKSDVYSYGMLVLEMVGARNKAKDEVENTSSEFYFPEWIYKRLEAGGDLELQVDMTEEEHEITKKMTTVGLWCIQTNPSQRPAMGRVLEMLEGSVQRLEFPPQPFLYSSSRQLAEYSTTITL